MNIKGAIFDMDGTLVDSLFLWEVIWKAFGDKYLNGEPFAPNAADDKAVRTVPLRDAMQIIYDHYGFGNSGEELFRLSTDIIRNFYATEATLKTGVRELLAVLQQQGVKMCVASATTSELIEVTMKHSGIYPYFSAIFSCADLGMGKEKPDVYLLAQQHLGTETAETWVFEDSLVALETASKIGMQTVGVFDRCNPYQTEIKAVCTVYVGEGESLAKIL